MTYDDLAKEWDSNEYICCHTSGSTGTPKEIWLPKEQMINSARRTVDFFGINEDSVLYSCISPDFIGGKMMLARQRLTGCKLKWEKPSNRPLNEYQGKDITLLSVVPSQMIHILDNLQQMPEIRNILVGGSAIPATLRKRIAESGVNTYESYGMTETASHIALRKIETEIQPFQTLGDIWVENCDGALKINIPKWQSLITNDIADILSPHLFNISGRLDNIIISGGKKINPEQVEEKMSEILTFPFFITSVPDDKWGQRLVMIAETNPLEKENIMRQCERLLESYERPKEIIFKDRLIRTPNGKLIRNFKS